MYGFSHRNGYNGDRSHYNGVLNVLVPQQNEMTCEIFLKIVVDFK